MEGKNEIDISLAHGLWKVFSTVLAAREAKNGYEAWSPVVDSNNPSPEFYERVMLVRRACLRLTDLVSDGNWLSPSSRRVYERILAQALISSDPARFHENWEGHRQHYQSISDNLSTLDDLLKQRLGTLAGKKASFDDLSALLDRLETEVNTAGFDPAMQAEIALALKNIRFYLKNIEVFGLDGFLDGIARLVSSLCVATKTPTQASSQDATDRLWQFVKQCYSAVEHGVVLYDAAGIVITHGPVIGAAVRGLLSA